MKIILASLVLISSLSANAVCDKVEYLKEGDKAPCNGYLFTPEEEQKLRDTNERFKIQSQIILKQDEKINSLETSLSNAKSTNQELNRQLNIQETSTFFKVMSYFVGGLLVGYAVGNLK